MGGEKKIGKLKEIISKGSPPRGRGKAGHLPAVVTLSRITPAWAGKSVSLRGFGVSVGDHPRVGGEKK